MKKFIDTVLNQYGDPIQGVACTVLQYPSNALANIFLDNGTTQTTNPVYTDSQGMFSFYTGNGRYTITFTGSGVTKDSLVDVLIEDPAEAQSYNQVGGSINGTPIGATTPSTGNFTTLTAASLTLTAFNGPIGTTTPNAGYFTTLNANDLNVTNVANIEVTLAQISQSAYTLLGSTWASPGAIGITTPAAGSFTSLSSTGATYLGDTQASAINNTPIGATTPASGAFTTLSVSSGINSIPIGATTPSTGRFTSLDATGNLKVLGNISSVAPIAKTTAFTVGANEGSFIVTGSASVTVTLPSAAASSGRWISITNRAAFTVVSASANVIPKAGGAASTAICAATAGTWAVLQSDGTNWQIMSGS